MDGHIEELEHAYKTNAEHDKVLSEEFVFISFEVDELVKS